MPAHQHDYRLFTQLGSTNNDAQQGKFMTAIQMREPLKPFCAGQEKVEKLILWLVAEIKLITTYSLTEAHTFGEEQHNEFRTTIRKSNSESKVRSPSSRELLLF